MVIVDRTKIDCRDCRYWSYDMDMDAFCVHPNAGPWGTDVNAMRGVKPLKHTRGELCGPNAKLFKRKSRST